LFETNGLRIASCNEDSSTYSDDNGKDIIILIQLLP